MDTSDLLPGSPDPGKRAAATGPGEHWWPVALAILAAGGLHVALPAPYRVNPRWVVPVVLLVLLIVLIIGDPGRIDRQKPWLRVVIGIVIAFITVANLFSAARLIADILTSNKIFANNPIALLATGGVVWITNVIAFSPTDTMPLTIRAKALMALQSLISVAVLVVVLSRVINILPS